MLRSDLYAVAALAGSSLVVAGHLLGLPYRVSALVGGLACLGLRLMAIHFGWPLPMARLSPGPNKAAPHHDTSIDN